MSNRAAADRPATFREVLSSAEFRAVFSASTLSWFGDNAARAAVTALVFQRTDSTAASAAAFAISLLPWFGIGSVFAALAERYPYRRVMIICDVTRVVTMALVATPRMPIWAMIALLLATALLNPPFESARSAILPAILEGDRYIVGLSMQRTSAQATTILGYACGAALAGYDARLAVLFNSATFAVSAFVIWRWVAHRPPAFSVNKRIGIWRETAAGFTMVFRSRLLRAIALVTFLSIFFSILPEGLAAGWAAHLTRSADDRGWYQSLIMTANSVGFMIGSMSVGRFASPATRLRLIRPFAVLAPFSLIFSLLDPNVCFVTAMSIASGFFIAGLLPATNGLFVQALPNEFRARAFGVMQSGLQICQGMAILLGGLLADQLPVHLVVGLWASTGVVVMLWVIGVWPNPDVIRDSIAAAQLANSAKAAAPEYENR